MTEIVNTDEYEAWNGDSGRRWVADAGEAVDYLAGTGPGRAALDAMPVDRRPAALDAVRGALADHTGAGGVQLGAAIWIVTASTPA